MNSDYQQGSLIELEITDLSHSGDGVGKFQGRAIFVPDTVTGDRILVRLTHLKRQYAYGKLHQLLSPSPHRIRPSCIVADKCGGCQWQHIDPHYQQQAKQNQVIQALKRIGGFENPPVDPILSSDEVLGYRNKATYPLGLSATGNIQAGYYQRNSHQLINLNQCPLQDPRLNPFLAEIKGDLQQQGWTIYNEKTHQGELRHLALRIGKRTGEVFLTLVSTEQNLPNLDQQAQIWLERYPNLVGVALNYNPERGNTIFGEETSIIAGHSYLKETFANLEFQLGTDTFFQVNTEAAETLLNVLLTKLNLTGKERLIDAYCGVGTFTLPLAQQVQEVIGIEVNPTAITQARNNAQINHIDNVSFHEGTVETILPNLDFSPDLVLLDPPRKGCDRTVIDTLRNIQPAYLVYISCQPPTLARDLQQLCQEELYELLWVQPADFFPQTAHVEAMALVRHKSSDMLG
ncbi:23S rRNA (uracil(1939)-C(5))-methyltransferase RlmD [Crocosphaera sp. XPORK-15E]|uniref:23S rRNA (uracil(1939)-C(5))-methyltransferase RlmD n=1 Tax=Crocosphaera sp. XPORK-15E TaxID=3110247 RepID=UPI002B221147|nr:23S rRNA (uracil(1939)-C(5))-methyltransferase RlmD [Crocosphaera sp. XPORK-15E]MEA5532701.1 23S rRNA (uracil(1939)-C(5))-methyltransferase RlmD [Crocosphaera sp. XPORK-15E]